MTEPPQPAPRTGFPFTGHRSLGEVLGGMAKPAPNARRGDWLQTYTGRQYWPLDPRPEDVDLRDIAHALSQLCRYGGHTLFFYSVAEHSVLLSRWFESAAAASISSPASSSPLDAVDVHGNPSRTTHRGAQLALWALLHDAAEAYCVDLPRPVKRSVHGYEKIEIRNLTAIAQAFGLSLPPMPAAVKRADTAILADEQVQVMGVPPARWPQLEQPPLGVMVQGWSPRRAEAEFLERFEQIRSAP